MRYITGRISLTGGRYVTYIIFTLFCPVKSVVTCSCSNKSNLFPFQAGLKIYGIIINMITIDSNLTNHTIQIFVQNMNYNSQYQLTST